MSLVRYRTSLLRYKGGEADWVLPPTSSQFASSKVPLLNVPLVTPAKVGSLNPECALQRWTDSPIVVQPSPTVPVETVFAPLPGIEPGTFRLTAGCSANCAIEEYKEESLRE